MENGEVINIEWNARQVGGKEKMGEEQLFVPKREAEKQKSALTRTVAEESVLSAASLQVSEYSQRESAWGKCNETCVLPGGLTDFGNKNIGVPFFSVSLPPIPCLAKGAVLPANKPFLAVLGDQRHGTNIEAPLSTIQEAVDAVMESKFADMMDGFTETVAVLREILEAVYGIQIGDDVLGQAVDRYNRKMNIARGGVL